MPTPRALVVRAPGTNCDQETVFAFELAGAVTERLHVNRLLERPALLANFQILCIPGGFSYGDDLGAGRIMASQFRNHLCDAVRSLHDSGGLVLGLCNGFQVLIKSGLLLADEPAESGPPLPPATLVANESGKFEARWIRLQVQGKKCVFFAGIETLELPVAHGEGRFVSRDPRLIDRLRANEQIALTYAARDASRGERPPYPDNPNGSMADIAGICDPTGRICGLMPHPERFTDPLQHPQWTRRPRSKEGDGLQVFKNAVRYFR